MALALLTITASSFIYVQITFWDYKKPFVGTGIQTNDLLWSPTFLAFGSWPSSVTPITKPGPNMWLTVP